MTRGNEDDLGMRILTVLGQYEREYGERAHNALLKKYGATSAIDVKPKDFKAVIAECTADEDDAPRRRNDRTKSNARTPRAMETVINSQPDIKSGLNMAAKAIHARPAK